MLDLISLVWSRIPQRERASGLAGGVAGEEVGTRGDETLGKWPPARYFHSMDAWNGKLVLFGGMGAVVTPPSTTATTAATVQPCVLDDVWLYDIATGTWEECGPQLPRYTSSPPSPTSAEGLGEGEEARNLEPVVPKARYAHLSAVVGDRLVVIGGQELSNE